MKSTIRIGGGLMDVERPKVMGILNITPDSFYAGSRMDGSEQLLHRASEMIEDGVDILDIGGQSTRPGSKTIDQKEELNRVLPSIRLLRDAFPDSVISIDTHRSVVAAEAIEAGANMVNDISGGRFDEDMFRMIGQLQVPYVLMHIQGRPATMQKNPHYTEVVKEVFADFKRGIDSLLSLGVKDIILDPGYGFGKNLDQNYELLMRMDEFKALGFPILAGISRKSMITKVLNVHQENALNGTSFLHAFALMKGANILRVHDVKEAVECIRLMDFINDIRPNSL